MTSLGRHVRCAALPLGAMMNLLTITHVLNAGLTQALRHVPARRKVARRRDYHEIRLPLRHPASIQSMSLNPIDLLCVRHL